MDTTRTDQLMRSEPVDDATVFEAEWEYIDNRRAGGSAVNPKVASSGTPAPSSGSCARGTTPGPPPLLSGLALSGGGIRSATFCLGLLQGLARHGLLPAFDYLSTVSGGGFAGGWWMAWCSRANAAPELRGELREQIEPDRPRAWATSNPTGGRFAGVDPLHHLRLFSNYLTPRKGILSLDLWRAIAIISRNLAVTWLTLLPLLAVPVILAQLYFIAVAPEAFVHAAASNLGDRAMVAAAPALVLLAWIMSTIVAWLLNAGEESWLPNIGAYATAAIGVCAYTFLRGTHAGPIDAYAIAQMVIGLVAAAVLGFFCHRPRGTPFVAWGWDLPAALAALLVMVITTRNAHVADPKSQETLWIWVAALGAVAVVSYGTRAGDTWADLFNPTRRGQRKRIRRNRLINIQSRLMIATVAVIGIVGTAGFGPDVWRFLTADVTGWAGSTLKGVSWASVIGTLAGAAVTAFRASPTGGADRRTGSASGPLMTAVITVVPPALILVLAFGLSAAAHHVLTVYVDDAARLVPLGLACLAAVALCCTFGICEVAWFADDAEPPLGSLSVALGSVGLAAGWILGTLRVTDLDTSSALVLLCGGLACALVILRLIGAFRLPEEQQGETAADRSPTWRATVLRWFRIREMSQLADNKALAAAGAAAFFVAFAFGSLMLPRLLSSQPWLLEPLARYMAAGVVASAGLLVSVLASGRPRQGKALLLLGAGLAGSLAVLMIGSFDAVDVGSGPRLLMTAHLDLAMAALGWVLALGWMLDPNTMSMHTFYQSRLLRAYIGASNPHRQTADITDADAQDDVYLKDELASGAPYHLTNCTLNLVGGGDLATAQRLASPFVFAPLYCGSSDRTGYRQTRAYMDGRITLSTAVAVSGAAASPAMGSGTPTAALAMVMTLMNVRLGFWAATPHLQSWRSRQPRLWPFYTLREFLSQTDDRGSYSYLTDGGHFDNTGVYALIQRGCRYIVMADCGADPQPYYTDIGNLVRRCRIDFDTEIALDTTAFDYDSRRLAKSLFVVGTVRYARAHLKRLHHVDDETAARLPNTGIIVWIKPARVEGVEPDLRQYGLEHNAFPQDTTVDQWFSESQFESYRRLGLHSAEVAFPGGPVDGSEHPSVALRDLVIRLHGLAAGHSVVSGNPPSLMATIVDALARSSRFTTEQQRRVWTPEACRVLEQAVETNASKLSFIDLSTWSDNLSAKVILGTTPGETVSVEILARALEMVAP